MYYICDSNQFKEFMAENIINIEEVKKKNEIVDNAIKVLKTEFIGIDKQIEEVMNNVRTWYLYPSLQTRPLVIAIWGLSGTGKTMLVKRISQLLNVEEDFVYWNFASINESSSWEIEDQIEEQLSNERSNRMFVYDEFQYAATLDMKGEEKDNKSGLKPFWELLDSGIIHKRTNFYSMRVPYQIMNYMIKINLQHEMKIENGVWVNADECLMNFSSYDIMQFHKIFKFSLLEENDGIKRKVKKSEEENITSHCKNTGLKSYDADFIKNSDFFINEDYLDRLFSLYEYNQGSCDRLELYHKLLKMNYEQVFNFIADIYDNIKKGYDLNFKDSVIFVIGNLDEAYQMSFDINPDMSPDQFRKITEKISVVDIKDALKKRFRNEQIARLGNIHVIYPSFSQKNFEDIINLSLNTYEKEVHDLLGYHLKFEESIKKLIYEEGVFPTHGTRPIFSTIYEIVKSRLPEIVLKICNGGYKDEVETIVYSFIPNDNTINVVCIDKEGNNIFEIPFKDVNLRLKNLRESDSQDEEQALCALHESGHFVMYAKLTGKMPVKLVSKTAESDTGGFLMEDVNETKKKISKRDMLNEIQVLLGGYVAEKEFFGEEMTGGASNDLVMATKLASKMIRRFSMGSFTYVATNTDEGTDPYGLLLKEENQVYINNQIKDILSMAEAEVRRTFMNDEWRKMLKESALYLCDNSAMSQKKMKEIYDRVSDSVKTNVRNNTFYHDIIANI